MNNKYVHINMRGILRRSLDVSGWLSFQARVAHPSTPPPQHLQPALGRKLPRVLIWCVRVCGCIRVPRCVVWSRISGRCLWRCGAQLERERLYILMWPNLPEIPPFRTSESGPAHTLACSAIITGYTNTWEKKDIQCTQAYVDANLHI